ncbi:MAG: hypothetical protein OXB84_00060, partial [Halobacteriovoraceae bacterium]|nr:hypothetical protein [Halobacteriovoraceae bacterium]
MLLFYTADNSIESELENVPFGDVHFTDQKKEILKFIKAMSKDESCLLFLDFDLGQKAVEKLNASLMKNKQVIRVIFAGDELFGEFKNHQQSKTAAKGYFKKPLTGKVIKETLQDFQLIDISAKKEILTEDDEEVTSIIEMHSLKGQENVYKSTTNDEIQKV